MIEGSFNPGDKALIIEDVITGGTSILETAIVSASLPRPQLIFLLYRAKGFVSSWNSNHRCNRSSG